MSANKLVTLFTFIFFWADLAHAVYPPAEDAIDDQLHEDQIEQNRQLRPDLWGVVVTRRPTNSPTSAPTWQPTNKPTSAPTWQPTNIPTVETICPMAYDSTNVASYVEGSEVEVDEIIYRCNGYPFTIYCTMPNFKPGNNVDELWKDAWKEVNPCRIEERQHSDLPSLRPFEQQFQLSNNNTANKVSLDSSDEPVSVFPKTRQQKCTALSFY